MSCGVNLMKSFMSCEHEHEAIEITEKYNCPNVFAALADGSGEFQKFSRTVEKFLGMGERQLLDRAETIFSLSRNGEKLELFKAFSSTLNKGSVYSVMHHLPRYSDSNLPVVTHMKKVTGSSGQEMLLCLNILA